MFEHLLTVRIPGIRHYGFGPDNMCRIKVCSLCGTPCKASQKRCHECGAGLPKETLYEAYKKRIRFCSQCDAIVSVQTAYCPKCGKKLK